MTKLNEALEPLAMEIDSLTAGLSFSDVVQLSTAISMRRLADFICGSPRNFDIIDRIADWRRS